MALIDMFDKQNGHSFVVGSAAASFSSISLIKPWVAAVMKSSDLPIAGAVLVGKFNGGYPFYTLPKIKFRNYQSYRSSVLGDEVQFVMLDGK